MTEETSSTPLTTGKKPSEEEVKKTPQEKNTGMAIVAYLLFFVPLLTDAKADPFVKYHVKQGFVLFVGWILVGILNSILPWSLDFVASLLDLGLFVLMVMGIISASKGEQKPLPYVGIYAEQFKF
jgi:uncharacterized membrane protein